MSTHPSSANPAALMHEVSAALRRGDVQAAERMLTTNEPSPIALAGGAPLMWRTGLPQAELMAYLKAIRYQLGPEELSGAKEFEDKLGLQ